MPANTMGAMKTRYLGCTVYEHTLEVPWDPQNPELGTFELFARELVPAGGEHYPAFLYLQGGPGFPAPRPISISGVIREALKTHRVILLDQRGTGRSHRIDCDTLGTDADKLHLLRQEFIVHDAEALRKALGISEWTLYGQSFGGFCITSYFSLYPESVDKSYITGGLPALEAHVDDVYRATYAAIARRSEEFYSQFPWAEARIREICHHLDNSDEKLPTGERLSSRRFRTIGITLGRSAGFYSLAYLLESPFQKNGEKKLRTDVLAEIGAQVSFASAPLYAAIHESIYGGIGGPQTAWSAHRLRGEIEGFAQDADPRSNEKFYLTGEHIYPWHFEEDPALVPFAQAAQDLAMRRWDASPYRPEALAQSPVTAACVYVDDAFVPYEYSLHTADKLCDARLHITNQYQHDGIHWAGEEILALLKSKVADH